MKFKSLLAATLGLALALSALSGVALAGKPDDPGKSEEAPGQVKKAEEAPAPVPAAAGTKGKSASAPGQAKKATKAPTKGKSATAPGRTKTGTAATPTKGKSETAKTKAAAKPEVRQQGNKGGRSAEAHHHVIVCHRTGSDSNPYVVINIPMTAWTEAHSPDTGSHPTLNGRDDILLHAGPVPPGGKMGFTKDDCEAPQQPAGGVEEKEEQKVEQPVTQDVQPTVVTQEAAPQEEQGGVLGVQAVAPQPAPQQAQGGVLGRLGAVAQQQLPFTGLPLWIAVLAGAALVGAGLGVRRSMR